MRPIKDEEIPAFRRMIEGNPYEGLFYTAVFTGMREMLENLMIQQKTGESRYFLNLR